MVVLYLGTWNMFFFASSTALAIAEGTSLALPYPTPTRSTSSPTTTSAVNEKRRPPFTTLATRLILTTRSCSSRLSRSFRAIRSAVPLRGRRLRVPSPCRGRDSRRGRTRQFRCRPTSRARRSACRQRPGRRCVTSSPAASRRWTPPPACGRPRHRSAARRCARSSGTRPDAAARPSLTASHAPGDAAAVVPVPSSGRSCALTDLPDNLLARVSDALALVGLRRAPLADLGGDLADHLLGNAA